MKNKNQTKVVACVISPQFVFFQLVACFVVPKHLSRTPLKKNARNKLQQQM
jgi:hypothetical protein